MKKITLFIFSLFIGSAFSQVTGIVIEVEGSSTDYSGSTYSVVAPSDQIYEFNFLVKNYTGSSHDWYITREKINVDSGWSDGCCWGHSTDPFGGTCFSSGQMDLQSWTMPTSALFTLDDGEYGKLKPQVNPADGTSGQSHYRYYIGEEIGGSVVYMDSVDLIVAYTVGVNSLSSNVSVSIVPNPATEYLNVSINGINKVNIDIYDVLGNKIASTFVEKSKNIDVRNYKNGVYFINIKSPNKKAITRKIVIRH